MGLKEIISILKSPIALPVEPPEWWLVIPYGEVLIIGEDEPKIMDDEGALSVLQYFKSLGRDMVIDYEHQTLMNMQAPAAGWIKELQWRGKDGLWARTEWTHKGAEYIRNKEYKYFSPVMIHRKSDRRIVALIHVALTNEPRMMNVSAIAAKMDLSNLIIAKMSREEARAAQEERSRKYKIGVKEGGHVTKPGEWENVPDDEWLDPVNYRYPCPDAEQTRAAASYWGQEDNQAQYNPEERSIINGRLDTFRKKHKIGEFRKEANKMEFLKKLIAKLKMKEDSTEDQVMQEFDKIMAKNADLEKQVKDGVVVVASKNVMAALKLEENADEKTVVAKIESLSLGDTAALDLAKKVNELTETISAMKTDDLTTQALKNGQTSPEELKTWGNDLAKKDPEKFKQIVLSRGIGSVVPIKDLNKQMIIPGNNPDETQLSINKMMGINKEIWEKYGPKEAA